MTPTDWLRAIGISPSQAVRRRLGIRVREATGCPGTWDQVIAAAVVPVPVIARAMGQAQADVEMSRAKRRTQ